MRNKKKFIEATKLLKQDKLYKEAMETANASNDVKIVSDLLNFFITNNERECFSATLFTCYNLIEPDVVMELAWKNGLIDQCMPYLIQSMRDMNLKIKELDERTKINTKKEDHQQQMTGLNPGFMLANNAYNEQFMGGHPQQMFQPPQQQMMMGGGMMMMPPNNFNNGSGF